MERYRKLYGYLNQLRDLVTTKLNPHRATTKTATLISVRAQLMGMMFALMNPVCGFAKMLNCMLRLGSLVRLKHVIPKREKIEVLTLFHCIYTEILCIFDSENKYDLQIVTNKSILFLLDALLNEVNSIG